MADGSLLTRDIKLPSGKMIKAKVDPSWSVQDAYDRLKIAMPSEFPGVKEAESAAKATPEQVRVSKTPGASQIEKDAASSTPGLDKILRGGALGYLSGLGFETGETDPLKSIKGTASNLNPINMAKGVVENAKTQEKRMNEALEKKQYGKSFGEALAATPIIGPMVRGAITDTRSAIKSRDPEQISEAVGRIGGTATLLRSAKKAPGAAGDLAGDAAQISKNRAARLMTRWVGATPTQLEKTPQIGASIAKIIKPARSFSKGAAQITENEAKYNKVLNRMVSRATAAGKMVDGADAMRVVDEATTRLTPAAPVNAGTLKNIENIRKSLLWKDGKLPTKTSPGVPRNLNAMTPNEVVGIRRALKTAAFEHDTVAADVAKRVYAALNESLFKAVPQARVIGEAEGGLIEGGKAAQARIGQMMAGKHPLAPSWHELFYGSATGVAAGTVIKTVLHSTFGSAGTALAFPAFMAARTIARTTPAATTRAWLYMRLADRLEAIQNLTKTPGGPSASGAGIGRGPFPGGGGAPQPTGPQLSPTGGPSPSGGAGIGPGAPQGSNLGLQPGSSASPQPGLSSSTGPVVSPPAASGQAPMLQLGPQQSASQGASGTGATTVEAPAQLSEGTGLPAEQKLLTQGQAISKETPSQTPSTATGTQYAVVDTPKGKLTVTYENGKFKTGKIGQSTFRKVESLEKLSGVSEAEIKTKLTSTAPEGVHGAGELGTKQRAAERKAKQRTKETSETPGRRSTDPVEATARGTDVDPTAFIEALDTGRTIISQKFGKVGEDAIVDLYKKAARNKWSTEEMYENMMDLIEVLQKSSKQ
jgi:hypothetical protein